MRKTKPRKHDAQGRTKGARARHVRLYHHEMASEAWRSLNCVERCLYLELLSLFNGTNNGEIGLSVRRAAKLLGINKDTAQKAFKGLKEHKFIKMVKKGSYDLKCRHSSEYELTALDCRERAATKDYMSWKGPREQRLKQKPVPPRRTDGPVTSDCSQREKDPKCTHSPNTSDRGTSNSHPHGPTHSDTYSLPSSGVLAHPSVGPAKIESPERLGDTKDELANNWMGGA